MTLREHIFLTIFQSQYSYYRSDKDGEMYLAKRAARAAAEDAADIVGELFLPGSKMLAAIDEEQAAIQDPHSHGDQPNRLTDTPKSGSWRV